MSYQGFIKLHRQVEDWEWYKNIPVKVLFIHCLLRANHKERKWQGINIKRGQFITSLDNLAYETGLTKMQIRTAINKLKLTHEITYQTTHSYSMITVNNWDNFQLDNTPINTPITYEQHANNTPITLNNNDKNDNNEKKYRERDRKILENYLLNKKRAKPIDNIDAYIDNIQPDSLERLIKKAQKWQENQEKKKERSRKNEVEEQEITPEEQEKIREIQQKIRKGMKK